MPGVKKRAHSSHLDKCYSCCVQGSVLTKSHTVTPKCCQRTTTKNWQNKVQNPYLYVPNIAELRFTFSDVNTQKIGKGRCSAEKKKKSYKVG